jgi:hypothetical protein
MIAAQYGSEAIMQAQSTPDRPNRRRKRLDGDQKRVGQSAWVRLLSFAIGVTVLAAIFLGWGLLHEFWLFIIYWLQP